MPYSDFSTTSSLLLKQFSQLASSAPSISSLQQGIADALAEKLPRYSWTGFYMLEPDDSETLVLGPFVGEPTPHTRIPVTQGICGAAVAAGKTVIVDDVNSDPPLSIVFDQDKV